MAVAPIFTRIRPEKIELNEEYAFFAEISGNSKIVKNGVPNGVVEVLVPYDGADYFTKEIIEDIKRQDHHVWDQENVDACIGHIGITNHSKTDLEDKLELTLNRGIIPLLVPIKDKMIENEDALRDGRYKCRIRYEYEPTWPETIPIQIRANIIDEEIIKEVLGGGPKEQDDHGISLESVGQNVSQQVGFSQSLIFSFQLELALSNQMARFTGNDSPILEFMALEWPVATSSRVVHLFIDGYEHPLLYDPSRGVIEWRNIQFIFTGKSEGTELSIFQTPTIILKVDQPGELYQREQLSGDIQVRVPRQFSGVRLSYFNAQGYKDEIGIGAYTTLNTALTLYLEDLFERKTFSPYQHLFFEGVVLDEMRVRDITTLLEDQGFSHSYEQLSTGRTGLDRYLISGSRIEGHGKLLLWMVVEGTRSRTTRRKQIPGGETYTTELETGNVVIYMRGQLERDSSRLIDVMNEIQTLLKERFMHVSTIE